MFYFYKNNQTMLVQILVYNLLKFNFGNNLMDDFLNFFGTLGYQYQQILVGAVALLILIFRIDRFFYRYFDYRRNSLYSNYNNTPTINNIEKRLAPRENKLANRILTYFRRKRALNKCKKFVTKTNYLIRLKNNYINFSYLTEKKIITCQELNKEKRTLTVDWKDSCENEFEYNSINNIFEKMFDNICLAFNEKTTYDNLAPILKNYFKTKEENPNKKTEEIKNIQQEEQEIKKIKQENLEEIIIDINKSTEEELTQLAGITIIKAKQIIKYRDLHKGFKSKEEFFEQMKIKKHFRVQQAKYIVLSDYEIPKEEIDIEERIIDF